MADHYLRWTRTGPGRFLSRRLGLPRPTPLHRWSADRERLEGGPLLHLTPVPSRIAAGGTGAEELAVALGGCGLPVRTEAEPGVRHAAVVVDATGVTTVAELRGVHAALHPVMRALAECGRIVVLGSRPDPLDHHQAAAQQALEGFVRSLGKETGGGRTVQLLRFAPGAGPADASSTLGFLLSPKSAYVSGQVIEIGADPAAAPADAPADPARPLAGRTALVTGAARGIGASVAATLARDGAHVICLDVPQAGEELTTLARELGGSALTLDITAEDAGERLVAALAEDGHGGRAALDVLVHNAGITRDRRLANMGADRWDAVLEVNLDSVLRTTDHLLKAGALPSGTGRIIATASIAGIAGNTGQTNYGASKAGVIGLVRSLAPRAAAEHGVTVNAVAPGFIETKMTAAVPLFIREAGRRMNSHAQGGLPVDVAETTAWFARPGSYAVNGQVVRVCGQSLLGA
ncbi:3-oxoacyl-ACP reductase [Streptomyces sp. HNM0574]|uniref:3-oxoacyl-ACP reductase n=1 Tax=Streptomyces sp. HNM0574 TaxID=2714954 RepID=UPI00146AAE72|nr:3-oxoacyl-ACP reductase [Streptomyces sp. HNM0574]NLU70279.1 3-oxoacyl-ACP reductase [Streptomyces sp. HNM0574]